MCACHHRVGQVGVVGQAPLLCCTSAATGGEVATQVKLAPFPKYDNPVDLLYLMCSHKFKPITTTIHMLIPSLLRKLT